MPFDNSMIICAGANPKANLTAQQFALLTKPSSKNQKKERLKVAVERFKFFFKSGTYYDDAKLVAALSQRVVNLNPNAPELDTVEALFDSLKVSSKRNTTPLSLQIQSKRIPLFLLNVQNTPQEHIAEYYKQANNDPTALHKLVLSVTSIPDSLFLTDVLNDFDFSTSDRQSILMLALKYAIMNDAAEKVQLIANKLNEVGQSLPEFAIKNKKYEIANTLISYLANPAQKAECQELLANEMLDDNAEPSLITRTLLSFDTIPNINKKLTDYYLNLVEKQDYKGAIELLLSNAVDDTDDVYLNLNAEEIASLMTVLSNKKALEADQILTIWLSKLESKATDKYPDAQKELENEGYYFPDDLSESYPALLLYFVNKEKNDEITDLLLINIANLCGIDISKTFENALKKLDPALDISDPDIIDKIVVMENAGPALNTAFLAAFDMNEVKNGVSYLSLVAESDLPEDKKMERIFHLTTLGANPLSPFSATYDIEDFIKSIKVKDDAIGFVRVILEILSSRIQINSWTSIDPLYKEYDEVVPGFDLSSKKEEKNYRSAIVHAMLFELLSSKLEASIPDTNLLDLYEDIIAFSFTDRNNVGYDKESILKLALKKGHINLAKDYAALVDNAVANDVAENLFVFTAVKAARKSNMLLCREILTKLPISDYDLLTLIYASQHITEEFIEELLQSNRYSNILKEKLPDGRNFLHIALQKGWNRLATYAAKTEPTLFDEKSTNGIYPAHWLLNQHNIPIWNQFKDRFSSLTFNLDADPKKALEETTKFIKKWMKGLENQIEPKFDALSNEDYKVLADQQKSYYKFCQQLLVNGEAKDEIVTLFDNLSQNAYSQSQKDDFKKGNNLTQFLDKDASQELIALVLMRMGSTGNLTYNDFKLCPQLFSYRILPLVVLGSFKICGKSGNQEPFMLQAIRDLASSNLSNQDFRSNVYSLLMKLCQYFPIEEIDAGLREKYSPDPTVPETNAWTVILNTSSSEHFIDWIEIVTQNRSSMMEWVDQSLNFDAKEEYYAHCNEATMQQAINLYKQVLFIVNIDEDRAECKEISSKLLTITIKQKYVNLLKDVLAYTGLSTAQLVEWFTSEEWNGSDIQEIIDLLGANWQFDATEKSNILHTTVAKGNRDVFYKLIDEGFDITLLNDNSDTILVTAVKNGQSEMVGVIIDTAKNELLDMNVSLSLKKAQQLAIQLGYADIADKLNAVT